MIKVPGFRVNKTVTAISKIIKQLTSIKNLAMAKKINPRAVSHLLEETIISEIKVDAKLLKGPFSRQQAISRVYRAAEALMHIPEIPIIDVPGKHFGEYFVTGKQSGENLRIRYRIIGIMQSVITIGQFRHFVESSGYKIKGYDDNSDKIAGRLRDTLKSPLKTDRDSLFCLSRSDGVSYADWSNRQTERTRRMLILPTDDEWETIVKLKTVKENLSGNCWEWTRTDDVEGKCFLCSRYHKAQISLFPDERHVNTGLRFLEVEVIE